MKMLNLAIVDDSTTDLYILSSNFKKIDYIKIKMMALNGADFIAKLENEKPDLDLLLIDLRMPVLNGIDTIKILNQMKINFKIIAMSHGYYSSALVELQQLGVKHYCQKNFETILENIPKVMEGSNIYNDLGAYKLWENLSQKGQLKVQDEGYWRKLLSPVDLRIIKCLARGLNSQEVSALLGYEPSSIDKYRTNLLRTLNLKNSVHLNSWGFANGILNPSDVFNNDINENESA